MANQSNKYPSIVQENEWLAARKELLIEEKEITRARDELNVQRRRLPMVEIGKKYVFEGENGHVQLLDLFDGRSQLIIHHFMFDPSWDRGCPSCTFFENEGPYLPHLHKKDTSYAVVSRAPFVKIDAYKQKMGWSVPWYSSFDSEFNYDFHVTMDETITPVQYNYREKE